jgi:hypothetical protein
MLTVSTPRWGRRADAAMCLVLAVGSATYLMLRRWPLGASDEGYYFYHAIRVLEGDRLYRDVSELMTPLCIDLLALAFRLFGATITTGRALGAAIQALLTVAIFTGARMVGVGPALAVGPSAGTRSTGRCSSPRWSC